MNRRKILRNIFNLTISEIVSRLLNFISYVYLARVILAEGFGIISFIIAFSSYFLLVVNFSSDIIASREIARLESEQNHFVNKIISLRLMLACLSYLLLVNLVFILNQAATIKTGLLIYGLTFFAHAINLTWYFKGREKTGAVALAQIMSSIINLLLMVVLVKNATDITVAFMVFSCASLFNSVLLVFRYLWEKKKNVIIDTGLKEENKTQLVLDWGFIKNNLKESLPVAIAGIMISIYYNLDHVMLGYMTNATELGYYAAAYKIVIIALVPVGVIYQSFLPQLSIAYNDSEFRAKLMDSYSKGLLIVGSFFSVMVYLFANDMISLLYGYAFINSTVLLQILSLNIFLVYLNVTYGNPLIAWNKQKIYSYSIIAGAVSNIFLNLILIPKYHALGAAIATISSEIIVMIGIIPTHFLIAKRIHFSLILKSILMMLMTSALIFCLKDFLGLIPKLILALVIFLSLIFVLRLTNLTRIRMLFNEI